MRDFGFLTFSDYCVRGPRAPLPAIDCFGEATGLQYRLSPRLLPKPGSARHGDIANLRGGEPLIHHAYQAKEVGLQINTSSFAADVRGHVPWWIPEWGPRSKRKAFIVLERVVAVELLFRPDIYHFHVITTTRPLRDEVVARLASIGVTSEHLTPEKFTPIQHENAEQCYAALRGVDLRGLDDLAKETARRLCASRTQGTLRDKLGTIRQKAQGNPADPLAHADIYDLDIYTYAAVLKGYLVPDPRFRFQPFHAIHLLPRARRAS